MDCRAALAMTAVVFSIGGCAGGRSDSSVILGDRPNYGPANISAMPNQAAIGVRIWVPGLDNGYDPQGLAYARGSLIVSGYQSTSLGHNKGSCRVFRLDPSTGRQSGSVDVPAPCGHAGGIAYTSDGYLYVSDTHTLFGFPLADAFRSYPPLMKAFPLGPGLTGGLATSDGKSLWIGTYETGGPGRLFQFDAADLRRLRDGEWVTMAAAKSSVEIPSYAQGAAVDPDGRHLWISRSGIDWATLDELDRASGRLVARYPAPPGLEGLDFDPSGTLWSISEAGARRFYSNPFVRLFFPFNPLILAIHTAALRAD